jgi:hypothetical protein
MGRTSPFYVPTHGVFYQTKIQERIRVNDGPKHRTISPIVSVITDHSLHQDPAYGNVGYQRNHPGAGGI